MSRTLQGWRIGLAAGLVELGLAVLPALLPQPHWPGMFHVSPHWLWLKPLAGATVGATIAAAGALGHRAMPGIVTPRLVLWALVAVGLTSILLPYRGTIGGLSLLILAAGGALPTSHFLAKASQSAGRTRAMSAIATGLLLIAGLLLAYRGSNHSSAASRGAAAPSGAPNVVLIVLDTVRAPSLEPSDRGLDGLPNLSRLASGGVEFTQAIATSSWTLESHASLFTGLYPPQVFTDDRTPINFQTPFPDGPAVIAEVLGRRGYATGGFVANTNYADYEHGLDRGFDHYDDYPLRWSDFVASSALGLMAMEKVRRAQGRPVPVGRRTASEINDAFLDWFDRQAGRPVFAFLNYFDAHDPYVPDPAFATGPPVENPMLNPYYIYKPDELRGLKHAYDDCVRYLDHAVGRLSDALERRGQLASTVFVVTSDHGEHFGEHDLIAHGNSLYRHSLQVPLVIRYPPAIPAGMKIARPVSLRDVPATLLALTVVGAGTLPGVSLSALWSGGGDRAVSPVLSSLIIGKEPHGFAAKTWPVSRGSMRSVVADGLHFIVDGDGREELFDWARDVGQTRNLAQAPEYAEARRRLRAQLRAIERQP